jgi:hypothetical protein
MSYTMHTSFRVHVSDELGDDGHEIPARIIYSVMQGYPDTLEEPGCGPTVSINSIDIGGISAPGWLFSMVENDEGLANELLTHAAETDGHARDQAADARRDERMMERDA